MSINLIPHWEFDGGSDWITAIDVIKGRYVFVGSRDGAFHILNWYGALLHHEQFGSWIGAIKVIEAVVENGEVTKRGPYVLLGTKAGDVRCLEVRQSPLNRLELNEIYSFKTLNTVREIDITSGVTEAVDIWVTVGSEDRHVYILNFADLISGSPARVKKVPVNGWIRSAVFCRDIDNEKPLIAAGCGDKFLYFFRLDGTQYARINVESKIHSIVSDQRSSKLYCTSDAKKLYVIGWQGVSYGIIAQKDLPHRATRLAFANDEFKTIFVVCEDFNIYVFDTNQQEIISWMQIGQRVFSIRDASWENTDIVLLGRAHGKLSGFMYTVTTDKVISTSQPTKGLLNEFRPDSLSDLAEMVLFGPKSQGLEVGIGRFLHVVSASEYGPGVCIVGTDGGSVAVINLDQREADAQACRDILYISEKPLRVWSVYGYWERKGCLRIFVATSEKEVLQYLLYANVQPKTKTQEPPIALEDWPREIRPVAPLEPGGKKQLLIACENGDLKILGDGGMQFNTGQILRTGYAKQMADGQYLVLVGSDNNYITCFRNQEQVWRRETLDKVREVVITEDGCLAVSEDRYLYVMNHEGRLKFRYRFPHRALCIDRYFDRKNDIWFVVGCGDGYVYFVNEHGHIREAHEFPDRIRDVKVYDDEVIVACEDRKVYFAPTTEKLFRDYYGDKHLEFIENKLRELQSRIHDNGLIEINKLSENEKLILLMYANEWFQPANVNVLVSLLDSSRETIITRDALRPYYIYANALIVLTTKGNFAAGKSRIEEYIESNVNNSYALHSIISTITQSHIRARRPLGLSSLVTIDTIVTRLPLSDEWLLEECVRNLYHAEFFSVSSGGFCDFFDTVQISYTKLNQIIKCALQSEHTGVSGSEMVSLIRLLNLRSADFRSLATFSDLLPEDREDCVKVCLRELNYVMTADETALEILNNVLAWIDSRIGNEKMKNVCKNSIGECVSSITTSPLQFSLVAELMENRLVLNDCLLTARDYLYILFTCSFMWTLAARFDRGPNPSGLTTEGNQ